MPETPSICQNCPAPPETAGACSGPIILVKEAAELRDFRGGDTVRAQSIGASALEELCGATFTPDASTIVEEPRQDTEPRYAVRVSEKLSSADEQRKRDIMAGFRDDIQRRRDPPVTPLIRPDKPQLTEVKATPQAQLWAELNEFVSDESIPAAANGCMNALDNATDLIIDALSTSQYQGDVLAFCQAIREHLDDILGTERQFKGYVSTYLASDISDHSGAVSEVASGYREWTQAREQLPVRSLEIAHINAVVMQLARAADTLQQGGFRDLNLLAETRNVHLSAVSRGSSNTDIDFANSASMHVLLASSRALHTVHNLIVKLDEVATSL